MQDYTETNIKIDGVSLKDIIFDLFKNELKLNVEIKNGTWRSSYEMIQTKEAQILGIVTKDANVKKNMVFSNPVMSENLYVASNKKKLRNVYDLKGQKIYSFNTGKTENEYLRKFLEQNGIDAEIVLVDDVDDYLDEYHLDSEFTSRKMQHKLFVAQMPPIAIGIHTDYAYLLPKVNKALKSKYSKILFEYTTNLNLYYQQKRFLRSLTLEEKEWLENKDIIKTAFEDDMALSVYSKVDNRFIGLLPAYTRKLSKIIGVPIEIDERRNLKWHNLLRMLQDNEIDFLQASITEDRKKKFIFSESIVQVPIFLIQQTKSNNFTIGVIKETLSETIAREDFAYSDILIFDSTDDLFKAFKNNIVGSMITPNLLKEHSFDLEHENLKIQQAPINLTFNKNNIILQSIFNKAIATIGDYEKSKITLNVEQEYKQDLLKTNARNKKYLFITILIFITTLTITLISIYKFYSQKRLNKALKYDILTKLQNRYLFNEICKNNGMKKGIVAVIDLDHFKAANDTYGHSIGDLVLIEVGTLLLRNFRRESTFRISGDEFYIFDSDLDFSSRFENFLDEAQKSEKLKKYNISLSIGLYNKEENEDIEIAFKKADKSMYEAKKTSGFSYVFYK